MLELRPSCEHCNKSLPANAVDAMICSYECTFCKKCVDEVLENVCPNCGGGFSPRPHRPRQDLKAGNYLGNDPASRVIKYNPVNIEAHKTFAQTIKKTPPRQR